MKAMVSLYLADLWLLVHVRGDIPIKFLVKDARGVMEMKITTVTFWSIIEMGVLEYCYTIHGELDFFKHVIVKSP